MSDILTLSAPALHAILKGLRRPIRINFPWPATSSRRGSSRAPTLGMKRIGNSTMAVKHYRDLNVHDAAKARLRLVFQHFERVCVAFSGGKDSSVTLHLALEVAREMKRGPVHAVFIDLEGQYQATIAHVTEMFDRPDVQPWWVCLPINLRNASSLREPYWCAWEPGREADWIRPLPSHPSVISDPARFPFYRHRMEFEEFVPEFNRWLARDASTAFLVGIRSDESLNRYLAVKRRTKKCAWTPPGAHKPLPWSTSDKSGDGGVTFFPIYDWKFENLWRYTGEHGHAYNRLYDQMLRAGVAFSQMRICQPYGDDQRKGLDLFHKLEPATWFRTVKRVEGANYAARYCRQRFLGYRGGLGLPPPSAPGANTASSCSTACRPRCARSTRGASTSSSSGGSNVAIPCRCGPTRAFPTSRTARRNRHGGASACRCSSRTWRAPCRSAPPGAISTPCFPPSPAPSHDPSPEALRIRTTALVRRRAGLLRPDGPLLRQRQRQARLRRLPPQRRPALSLVHRPKTRQQARAGFHQHRTPERRGPYPRRLRAPRGAPARPVPGAAAAGAGVHRRAEPAMRVARAMGLRRAAAALRLPGPSHPWQLGHLEKEHACHTQRT